jgi:hypothetical protein
VQLGRREQRVAFHPLVQAQQGAGEAQERRGEVRWDVLPGGAALLRHMVQEAGDGSEPADCCRPRVVGHPVAHRAQLGEQCVQRLVHGVVAHLRPRGERPRQACAAAPSLCRRRPPPWSVAAALRSQFRAGLRSSARSSVTRAAVADQFDQQRSDHA